MELNARKAEPWRNSMPVMPALLVSCLLTWGSDVRAQDIQEITWADLTVKVEFEDPFEDLTEEQLMHLSLVARMQALQERDPSKVSEGMQQEADEAEEKLRGEDVDIKGLLARREEIKQLRMKRAIATNPALDRARIRMPGYALPLEYDGKKVTEFLLVPWVGACIHTPPPPPNQIVSVTAAKPVAVTSRFEPVWVEGVMKSGDATKKLFLVDGASDISIGYSITSAVVGRYRSGPKATVRPAQH